MTKAICKHFCRERGWAIAGIENDLNCYCGDKMASKIRLPDSMCDKSCRGESDQICDGNSAIIIYYLDKYTHGQGKLRI